MNNISVFFAILVQIGIPLVGMILALWGLVDAVRRPASDFALAAQPRKFWLIVLALSAGVFAARILPVPIYLPFSGMLSFAAFLAVFFYLGPERQRMGSRGSRGPGRNFGGW